MKNMLFFLVVAVGMAAAACNTKNNDQKVSSQTGREQIENTTGGGFLGVNPGDTSAIKREPEKLTLHKGDDPTTYDKYPLVLRREVMDRKHEVSTLPQLGDVKHLK